MTWFQRTIRFVALFVAFQGSIAFAQHKSNELALGDQAKIEGVVEVPIRSTKEYDFLTQEQVFDSRIAAVLEHRELLSSNYHPSVAPFGQIEDGLPWWGVQGQFHYWKGEQSIVGDSEESRFIENPFLLVAPDVWFPYAHLDKHKIGEEQLRDPDFPWYPEPSKLVWSPAERWARVTYQVSEFARRRRPYLKRTVPDHKFVISVGSAYNARDFGFDWIYVDLENSKNFMVTPEKSRQHRRNVHFIHRGGSCGYPGGCNNMSPFTPYWDDFWTEALPAELTVRLWRKPPTRKGASADMTFLIELR